MKKYYAHAKGSKTIRAIKANSDEEALQKCVGLFGEDNFECGQLPHASTEKPMLWKERRRIMEEVYGSIGFPYSNALDRVMEMADNLHAVGAL